MTAEQTFLRELSQQGAQRETGNQPRCGPVQRPAECGRELGVGHRRGPGEIHRAGQLRVVDREQQCADFVLQADPRHVLPSIGQPSTQSEREKWSQLAQQPAGGGEHQTGARQHHPNPGVLSRCGGGLPVRREPGQKTCSRRCGFVHDAAPGVAVVADTAGVDQHRNPGCDHRVGDHVGGVDPAVAQSLLDRARPALFGHADAAHVDHRVDAVQPGRVEFAAVGIPVQLVRVARCAADDPQHPVVSGAQRGHQRRADQPGGSGDRDDQLVRRWRHLRDRARPRRRLPRGVAGRW